MPIIIPRESCLQRLRHVPRSACTHFYLISELVVVKCFPLLVIRLPKIKHIEFVLEVFRMHRPFYKGVERRKTVAMSIWCMAATTSCACYRWNMDISGWPARPILRPRDSRWSCLAMSPLPRKNAAKSVIIPTRTRARTRSVDLLMTYTKRRKKGKLFQLNNPRQELPSLHSAGIVKNAKHDIPLVDWYIVAGVQDPPEPEVLVRFPKSRRVSYRMNTTRYRQAL